MSLMDIINGFRGVTPNNPAGNPVTPVSPDNSNAGGNTTIPTAATTLPVTDDKNKSPLDAYKDLWTIDDKNKSTPTSLAPKLTIDNNKIMEVARTTNFTQGLDADLLSKASKGDTEAFVKVLNTVAQNSFAQGTAATGGLLNQAFTVQETNFRDKVMPDMLRKHTVSTVIADNPLSNIPAAQPILQTLERQVAEKYPTASPAEVKTHTETLLAGLAEEIVRANGGTIVKKQDDKSSDPFNKTAKTEDWGAFFNVDS